MNRDFNSWGELKYKLQQHQPPLFSEAQIWWCGLGLNIGDEQNGKGDNFTRPVVMMRKFNRNLFVGLPLSSQVKEHYLRHNFIFKGKQQSALLSQMRTLDARRLHIYMGKLSKTEINIINEKLIQCIFRKQITLIIIYFNLISP